MGVTVGQLRKLGGKGGESLQLGAELPTTIRISGLDSFSREQSVLLHRKIV